MVQIEDTHADVEKKEQMKMFLTDLFKKRSTEIEADSIIDLTTLCPDCSNSEKYMKRSENTGSTIISCAICNHEFDKT